MQIAIYQLRRVALKRTFIDTLRCSYRLYSNESQQRSIPVDTADLYKQLLSQRLESPADSKLLKVAVLGAPNSGKSSLINCLCRWRVCAVSQKVHTTRSKANVVLTDEEKQLIFVDTPGVVQAQAKKKHNLEVSLLRDPHSACLDDDVKLVCVVHDVANQFYRYRLDQQVLRLLHLLNAENQLNSSKKRFVLVLNKVDCVKKRGVVLDTMRRLTFGRLAQPSGEAVQLADSESEKSNGKFQQFGRSRLKSFAAEDAADEKTDEEPMMLETALSKMTVQERREAYKLAAQKAREENGFAHFSDIFIVSCLTQEGIGEFRDYLFSNCEPRNWLFPPSVVTDCTPKELVESIVWSKFLDLLDKEIPYSIRIHAEIVKPGAPDVDGQSESLFSPLRSNQAFNAADKLTIVCNAFCKDERSLKFALGKDGQVVRSIARAAKQELMNLFRCDVTLKLAIVLHKSERHKKAERKLLESLQSQAQLAQLSQDLRVRDELKAE